MSLALALVLVVLQLALLCIALVCTAVIVAGAISASIAVPFVPTPRRYFAAIERALDIQRNDVVYELGSGNGRLLLWLGKRHPDAQFFGIELNAPLYWLSLLRAQLAGRPSNVRLAFGDFFVEDLSPATKMYGYLLGSVMTELLPRLERQRDLRFVSRAFTFPGKDPAATFRLSEIPGSHGEHLLYVYDL